VFPNDYVQEKEAKKEVKKEVKEDVKEEAKEDVKEEVKETAKEGEGGAVTLGAASTASAASAVTEGAKGGEEKEMVGNRFGNEADEKAEEKDLKGVEEEVEGKKENRASSGRVHKRRLLVVSRETQDALGLRDKEHAEKVRQVTSIFSLYSITLY
jgi:hypothetical protein